MHPKRTTNNNLLDIYASKLTAYTIFSKTHFSVQKFPASFPLVRSPFRYLHSFWARNINAGTKNTTHSRTIHSPAHQKHSTMSIEHIYRYMYILYELKLQSGLTFSSVTTRKQRTCAGHCMLFDTREGYARCYKDAFCVVVVLIAQLPAHRRVAVNAYCETLQVILVVQMVVQWGRLILYYL